jgi:hypothetical protein
MDTPLLNVSSKNCAILVLEKSPKTGVSVLFCSSRVTKKMGYAVRKAMAQRASNIGGGLNPFLGSGIRDLTGADRSVETKT